MYGNEMSSENSNFLNNQPEATTGDKEKLQNETKGKKKKKKKI